MEKVGACQYRPRISRAVHSSLGEAHRMDALRLRRLRPGPDSPTSRSPVDSWMVQGPGPSYDSRAWPCCCAVLPSSKERSCRNKTTDCPPYSTLPVLKRTMQSLESRSISDPSLHPVSRLVCSIGGSEMHSGLCCTCTVCRPRRAGRVRGRRLSAETPRFCPPTNTLRNHGVDLHPHVLRVKRRPENAHKKHLDGEFPR